MSVTKASDAPKFRKKKINYSRELLICHFFSGSVPIG